MYQYLRVVPLVAAVSVVLAGEAFAHAELVSATPSVGGTVTTSPSELDLKFSEGLNLAFTGVMVIAPDKHVVSVGDAKLGAGGDTKLIVPIDSKLAAGTYTVDWHALSADGHKTHGSYTFTVKP